MAQEVKQQRKRGPVGVISALIDPLLFEGGRTVTKIAVEVLGKLQNNDYDKRAIINNVRSRMKVYSTKVGYRVVRGEGKTVQVVKE